MIDDLWRLQPVSHSFIGASIEQYRQLQAGQAYVLVRHVKHLGPTGLIYHNPGKLAVRWDGRLRNG